MKVGIAVDCVVCGRAKQPRGRSAPVYSYLCDSECKGFRQEPLPGDLWPGETEEDFGYPVPSSATREQTE